MAHKCPDDDCHKEVEEMQKEIAIYKAISKISGVLLLLALPASLVFWSSMSNLDSKFCSVKKAQELELKLQDEISRNSAQFSYIVEYIKRMDSKLDTIQDHLIQRGQRKIGG